MKHQELWTEYRHSRATDVRNRLIECYMSLVGYIASKTAASLPPHVEVSDLESVGILGLMNAIERFDPDKGIAFETFAKMRVYGAIMDELRSLDWIPRSIRQKTKKIEKACRVLDQKLGRTATNSEIAEHLEVSIPEFNKMVREVSSTTVLSLEQIYSNDSSNGTMTLMDVLESSTSSNPLDSLQSEELRDELARTIDRLPEKEKLILALYYYEELTLKEIGRILSLSESRISQIHTKTILKLRGRMAEQQERATNTATKT
ncbi:MAG: RNA polymerase sigma factor WhiG [Gemmatimonadetes bacterium]|nr:RNA polymerase sigma factor WhiG [Gemmatimonadota bacterium]